MPGIVVFKRRWSVGSDDLIVPAAFLVILHAVWVIVLGVILGVVHFEDDCADTMREHVLGYLVILSVCLLLEGVIAFVSMRGSILDTGPRTSMQYLLYIRLVVFIAEIVWLVLGVIWVVQNYKHCPNSTPKRAIIGIIVCNWLVMLSVLISLWCTFDTAGRSWVKMKRYQESIKEREQRQGQRRRSGSRRRNWRHRFDDTRFYVSHSAASIDRVARKAMRAYQESWDRRCKFLFCCVKEERHSNSFTEVAKLFTEFFRDLDVVPSDVVAGLVLLRRHQKLRRKVIVSQLTNEVYQFLSGVPITPETRFLHLQEPEVLADYKRVVHYMRYALAAYGWPLYMMMNTGTGLCKIMPELRCCCCGCKKHGHHTVLVEDNCCECNKGALLKLSGLKSLDLIYVTYHCDIGETPFYVAVDHEMRTVVISIRGTLSLQDVLTDLKADAEQLPVEPVREDWLGHKGMVQAAVYIKKKIKEEMLLSEAFGRDLEKGTQSYELVLVGHSLGAGTAAILAILLHNEYPNLQCYAYSPPGGLLSATTVEETKSFITSVVVGKDVVPRIGLHQLEAMRQDLINVIKISSEPKWKIIGGSMLCCCNPDEKVDDADSTAMIETQELMRQEKESRSFTHPSDSQIALTTHTPLYPPGKIIHIVRNHPKHNRLCGTADPVYQAIWADNIDFDEVLISPTMVQDHMPENVIDALEKVLVNIGPAKPVRKLTEAERKAQLSHESPKQEHEPGDSAFLETSFTQTNQTPEEQNRSSGAFSSASDNSLSWDYNSPLAGERAKDNVDLEVKPKVRPNRLELNNGEPEEDASGPAPLASPETLSDISSVDSSSWKGSRRSNNGYQKLTTGMPTMAPIQQSPLKYAKADGYHYFIPAPSPVDYAETPEQEFTGLSATMTAPLAQSTPLKTAVPESEETHRSPAKPPRQLGFTSKEQTPERELTAEHECLLQPDSDPDPLEQSTFNLTAEEALLQQKIAKLNSPDNYKLTFEDETLGNCSLNSEPYVPHSPDSYSNQLLYDPQRGHYSQGGRGYPHGGYMNAEVSERLAANDEAEDTLTSVTSMSAETLDSTDPEYVSPTNPEPAQNNNEEKAFLLPDSHPDQNSSHLTNGNIKPQLSLKSSNKCNKEKGNRVTEDLILPEGLQTLQESHL